MKYLNKIKSILSPIKPIYKIASFFYNRFILKSDNYWENRYRLNLNSGSGSYGRLAIFKSNVINEIIQDYQIKNIVELGVGDGNNLKLYKGFDSYTGFDVSRTIIEKNKKKFKSEIYKFYVLNEEKVPKCELIMSLDVIYHLIEDKVYKSHLNDLFTNATNLVLIYSSNFDGKKFRHVKHRRFSNDIPNNFTLIKKINNDFQASPNDPENTSIADFYLYKKVN